MNEECFVSGKDGAVHFLLALQIYEQNNSNFPAPN